MSNKKHEDDHEKPIKIKKREIFMRINPQLYDLFRESCTSRGMTIIGRVEYLMRKDLKLNKNPN